jgi:hypothetical protein
VLGESRWRAGVSYGVFDADLSMINGPDLFLERRAVSASLEYRKRDDLTLQFGLGAGIGGRLDVVAGTQNEVVPGWLASVAASWRLVDGQKSKPFVLLGLSLAGSGAATRQLGTSQTEGLYAFDARLGLTVGKTVWNVLSPYAAARVFGGPVLWRFEDQERVAGDRYHVQIAAGVVTALPRGLDLFVEVAPLGERGGTFGGGYSF